MDTRIKLQVQGLTNSPIQSSAYALILAEENGPHRIPVIVGTAEAQAIAIALEGIVPPRPLTHDLFTTFANAFGILLREVFIYKVVDGVFYSELLFDDGERQIRVDSRTSDAIAIALREKCDIYTTRQVVMECGIVFDEVSASSGLKEEEVENVQELLNMEPEEIKDEKKLKKWLALLNLDELRDRLEEAILNENYEFAKMYKDELRRREKGE